MRRWRRRLFVTLAVGLGVALAGGAVEGIYRLTRLSGLSPTTHPAYVEHDDLLGWRYRPGSRARHRSVDFDVEVAINGEGFRGPEWPPARDERPLLLILGDSFAFGWGVAEADTLTGVLRAAHPEWDVRNAAVAGYGTDQQTLLLRELRPRLVPDAVVCVFCANDLHENMATSAYGRRKPRYELSGREVVLDATPGPAPWLARSSYAYLAVAKLLDARTAAASVSRPEAEWALAEGLYRRMRDQLGGTPLVLVSDQARLAQFAEREPGLKHVDVGAALSGPGAFTFAHDGHWTAAAHRRVALAIGAAVEGFLR